METGIVGREAPLSEVEELGSLLMREDEVVLCLFQGDQDDVRRVAEAARIPCDRILEAACSPWATEAEGGTG